MDSLYEAWKRWGDKPEALSSYQETPPHFTPALEAFNFLKQMRAVTETGIQPLSLIDVQMYITGVLRYSDPDYTRWLIEMVIACDSAEREVARELTK